jgi:UDP-N-acetylglucosamine 2-epimerase (non-hydrolysing)
MVCFGTRPEVVKLAPVIEALEAREGVRLTTVTTGQHREMLDQTLGTFGLEPDIDLAVLRTGLDLPELTAGAIADLGVTVATEQPDAMIVQGDTTTAFCAALAAYYADVPVGHVEAGLRTQDLRSPFPEEANRRMVSVLARWHWCATERNAEALRREGVDPRTPTVTGNPVIDALLSVARRPLPPELAIALPPKRAARRILVTMHRRETLGEDQRALCRMLAGLAERPDVEIVFPVHLNPRVRDSAWAELAGREGVLLTEPLDYQSFVHVLKGSDLVVTDSGGVQEEAPVFGVPVVVMRDATERVEGIEAGVVRLAGTHPDDVRAEIVALLDDPEQYAAMAGACNPYGDGHAAERIVDELLRDLDVTPGDTLTAHVAEPAPRG